MGAPPDPLKVDALRTRLAVVVIGRNEGDRLRRCFESLRGLGAPVIYVDSGSTDDSLLLATTASAEILELDARWPFTAARARNAGWRKARAEHPDIANVQFVDGDCEMIDGWIPSADAYLVSHPRVAAVAGRLRERFPDRSVYNRLCEMEWDTPVGEVRAIGGIAMLRMDALAAVGGFREDLIAGEEPELCVRLRADRWKVIRLPVDMAWHDASMTRFDQWWRRSVRTGYAYAEGARLHGGPPERHWVRESQSAWVWGVFIPGIAVALALVIGPGAMSILAVYPLQVIRLARRSAGNRRDRWTRALFLVLGKFPEFIGQMKALLVRVRGQTPVLIEHK